MGENASEAAQGTLKFGFETLKAHRVVAFSHAENTASLRLMDRLGLQPEGRLRQTRWWQGGWSDEVVYAMLESEWPGSG
ncbi:MAG: GNAT family N-acetyltransferase [Anaerolineales bacterium]|nr:GNAT family N-acetyltransferase [Anaerolineales bacterium]